MRIWAYSFTTGRRLYSEAQAYANARLNEWIRVTGLPAESIQHISTQTVPFTYESGLVWHHTIHVFVAAESDPDPDFKIFNAVAEAWRPIQQHPMTPIRDSSPIAIDVSPKPPPRPRSEREERALIEMNNRRAANMGAIGQLIYEDWMRLCSHFGGICLKCKVAAPRLSIDHVIPMPEGPNLIENIQPLCRGCNSSKRRNSTDYRHPSLLASFIETVSQD